MCTTCRAEELKCHLTIRSGFSVHTLSFTVRWNSGENKRSLSTLQISQVHPNLIYVKLNAGNFCFTTLSVEEQLDKNRQNVGKNRHERINEMKKWVTRLSLHQLVGSANSKML